MNVVSTVIAAFVTVPILGYLIIFIISKQWTGNHRRSVHTAIDGSTVLFILSVHFIAATIWERSFLWLILLILVCIALIFVIIHWKYKKEIVLPKVFKGYWRFNFLLFFSAYIFLVLFGLIQRVAILVSIP
ncbi:DUF3397 domain-containing protein [Bacillus sp. T33-2]|uniref:DUF3397 domain-containing protein n=1 Tax=Bacillus sp. T33-2 TaxID=2054168 RepID=UPI000C777F7E|nr:DUF3397 domain-containing protein [Bacillus sp. T33-2]PLR97388.1 DUF3397 domain-containing protein [Bacillus sp. T33-2]